MFYSRQPCQIRDPRLRARSEYLPNANVKYTIDQLQELQVLSLTQFYSVNQGSVLESAFSTNALSRFASDGLDIFLGPLCLAWHTLWQRLFSSSTGSETKLLGGTEENSISPDDR